MSRRKLLIEIDAEDKFCGECEKLREPFRFRYYCNLNLRNGTWTRLKDNHKPIRCQACLDAEKDAKDD